MGIISCRPRDPPILCCRPVGLHGPNVPLRTSSMTNGQLSIYSGGSGRGLSAARPPALPRLCPRPQASHSAACISPLISWSPVGVTAHGIAMALHWCCLNTARGDLTAGRAPRAGLAEARATQGHPRPRGCGGTAKPPPLS